MSAAVLNFPRRVAQAIGINVHGRAQAILAAAESLMRDGYTILDFGANALSVKPVIWLMPEPRLKGLVHRDLAVYYAQGQDRDGAYRIGQFDRMGVSIRWIERL